MKVLTEREAWLFIAKAYTIPRGRRTLAQASITRDGICVAIGDELSINGHQRGWRRVPYPEYITIKVESAMMIATQANHNVVDYPYFWDICDPANDLLRADYCYSNYYRLEII